MAIMRFRPQGTQVPELTFEKDGKKIVIQGAIHIGSRKFYEKVVDRIKGFDGETHLEGIISDDENDPRKKLLESLYRSMASALNLSNQTDYVHKRLLDNKRVFNHDISLNSLGKDFLGAKSMDNVKKSLENIKISHVGKDYQLLLGSSLLANFALMAIGNMDIDPENSHIILDKRNAYAIDKALSTPHNVYLFWGAKHLEGMEAILLMKGFTKTKTRWLTIIPSVRLNKNLEDRRNNVRANILRAKAILQERY